MPLYISRSLMLLLIFSASISFAQNSRKISGLVTDTSKIALADISVLLILEKDTLRTKTDEYGEFYFNKVTAEHFTLSFFSMGFKAQKLDFAFKKNDKHLKIPMIKLSVSAEMLKEVVVKGKPNPVKVMQDTIEYNAAAFQVLEGDNIADLVKQFPGMEVDDEYNVKTMGKEVVKLRVNGKDFFTNNPKEFLAKLPAEIVSKIQIIDDFGEQANFTGLKIGEPTKMINIVTKPGMNQGKFGNMAINAGTNNQAGSTNGLSFWKENKQSGANLNFTTQNNGAGNSRNFGLSVNHRDKMGKNGSFGISYNGNNNQDAFSSEQAVETVSSIGTFYNLSQSNGDNKNYNNTLNGDLNFNNKKIFINGNLSASYRNSSNQNLSINNQSGALRQDLRNVNSSKGVSPYISANINISKKMNNTKSSLSGNFGFNFNESQNDQIINTNTLYYDRQNNTLLKDSVLNRTISNDTENKGFFVNTSYSIVLSKPKDTTGTKSLSINYSANVSRSNNNSYTEVLNSQTNTYRYVDSLSNSLRSLSINQNMGINYNIAKKKYRLTIGLNARPVLLTTDYLNLNQRITNNNFNYSPSFNFNKMLGTAQSLSFNYNGNNQNPSPNQLQPIRNTQNLQNIIIGNPNLRPSFSHSLSASYNISKPKSGAFISSTANFSTTQNEIINNIIIIPDTLGSFKQETRYENTNGTYNVSGNYMASYPIVKGKFTLSANGTLGFSNRAIFINNVRNFNSGLNFSQGFNTNVTLKKFSLNSSVSFRQINNNNVLNPNMAFSMGVYNPGQLVTTEFFRTRTFSTSLGSRLKMPKYDFNTNISYSLSNNSNNSLQNGLRNIQNLNLSLTGNVNIKKVYRVGFNMNKRVNSGFNLENQSPFIIGFNTSRYFLKNKALNANFHANDLLNQGNNLARYVSGNSIIDSRSNVITRVFTFGLSYNLSKFGPRGRNIRVDPD